ncbi:Hypothetical protein CINCED_3A016894 [Cinara cedri]|uniref:Uncharacterized protein n=1 Tax=Cinara cedri TaxID=506608 RepID=A0A5E4MC86_9HEMI|nr:Hypothetical protein CINCED_3A016894 [Cinara cedri]
MSACVVRITIGYRWPSVLEVEGIPTFSVTHKRKLDWEYVVPNKLLVGDRICQVHFPKAFLVKENTFCPGETKRHIPQVILKPDAYPLIESNVETQSNEPYNAFPIPQSNKSLSIASEININSNKYSSDEYEDLTLPLSPNLLQIKFNPNEIKQYGRKKTRTSINSARNIFEQIYLNTDAVNFPTDWCRVIPGNNINVIFSKI